VLSPVILIPAILNGLLTGAVYALVALGLTLIYGVLHIINFAHGAMLSAAMFAAFFAFRLLGLDPYVAIFLIAPAFFVIGYGLQRFVIGPASHGDDRNMLLVTLGLAVVIENVLLFAFRADTRTIDLPYAFQTIDLGFAFLAIPRIIGIARDNRESHRERLGEGLRADVLVTSAGVSAGDRDLVRIVLEELGVKQVFWKIGIKPGKPTAFGLKDGTPVFSLPGNPVSSLITFEEFVRPALLAMMGHRYVTRPTFRAILREAVRNKESDRTVFLRIRLEREGERYYAAVSGKQQTGLLKTMVNAAAIAVIPPDRGFMAAGEEVDVHFFGSYVELV